LTVGYVHFGADVAVRTAEVNAYYVNIPVSGSVVNRWPDDRQETPTTSGSAAVFTPGTPAEITWPVDCGQLAIKISPGAMQLELEA
jgi:hypothetical protein